MSDMFESASRSTGDLAGVFEYEDGAGYFYLYQTDGTEEGSSVIDAIHIVSGETDFQQSDVAVHWDRDEANVGLFIRGELWAVFDSINCRQHGGDYKPGQKPLFPEAVTFKRKPLLSH